MPASADSRILISTHGKHIHLLSLPPSPSSDLRLLSSLELADQPSFSLPHPSIPGLVYVSAWVPNIIFLVKVDGDELVKLGQTDAGGEGPTYFVMTPDRKSLLVACYRSAHLTRISLDPTTGEFLLSSPSPNDIIRLPSISRSEEEENSRSKRLRVRQDGAHAHMIIPVPTISSGEKNNPELEEVVLEYLVPDLGSDKIYIVTPPSSSPDAGWEIKSVYETKRGWGPRHAVFHTTSGTPSAEQEDDGLVVYVINELSSTITGHKILRNPTRLGEPFFEPVSTLPSLEHLRSQSPSGGPSGSVSEEEIQLAKNLEGYEPEGPMETIACAILLLPPSSPEGQAELLVSNRNLPSTLSPQHDPWATFPIGPGGEIKAETGKWVFGAGRHLRGVGVEKPGSAGEDGRRLLIASREGDGFTLYRQPQQGRGEWEELGRGLLKDEKTIELPLAVDWL